MKPYKNYKEEVPIEGKRLVQERAPINQQEQEAPTPPQNNMNKEEVKVTHITYNGEVLPQNQESIESYDDDMDMLDMWEGPWWLDDE